MKTAAQGNISSSSDAMGAGTIITQPVVNISNGDMTIVNAVTDVDDGSKVKSILGRELAVDDIPIAAIGVLGGIKPLSSGSTNRSGLVISEDGTTYVNTRADRGITRDGAGQIGINPATAAETAAGTEAYKPITPATLKTELNRLDYNKYKFDGFDVDKTSNTIRLYKACLDTTIDSTYNEGIYSYYVSSKGESVSEMENDGVLFVLYNDGVVRQILISDGSDGAAAIYSRQCDYISQTPGEWSEWRDLRADTFHQYSTTPKKIGVWIDGTPVWRTAVHITLTGSDFTTGYYELKADDLGVTTTVEGGSFVLNSCLRAGFPPHGMADSVPVEIGDNLSIGLSGVSTSYTILNGYIDFVIPEINIKS